MVSLVWQVGLISMVCQVWFGQVKFGRLYKLAITSYYYNFQTDKKPTVYFSKLGRVGRTTGTVIIELPQSSLAWARLSLAKEGKKCWKQWTQMSLPVDPPSGNQLQSAKITAEIVVTYDVASRPPNSDCSCQQLLARREKRGGGMGSNKFLIHTLQCANHIHLS